MQLEATQVRFNTFQGESKLKPSHDIGHPVPHPHLIDEQPASEGRRRGLLSAYPRTIHEETWLRGAWPTDKNGVVQFTCTLFCLIRYVMF